MVMRVKPPAIVPLVNWQSSWLDRVAFLCFMNESNGSVIDMVSGKLLTPGTTSAKTATLYGRAALIDESGNSHYINANLTPFQSSSGTQTGDITMLALTNPVGRPYGAQIVGQYVNSSTGSAQRGVAIHINVDGNGVAGSNGQVTAICWGPSVFDDCTATGLVDGNYHVFALRRLNGTLALWHDGVQKASVASVNDVQLAPQFGVGGGTIFGEINGNIPFGIGWNRGLSDLEMQQFSALLWDAFLLEDEIFRAPTVVPLPPSFSPRGWNPAKTSRNIQFSNSNLTIGLV